MILGQIIFGSTITIAPRAVVNGEMRDIGLGVWQTLGLEVLIDPIEVPTPCLDIEEMRRRNSLAVGSRRTLCS